MYIFSFARVARRWKIIDTFLIRISKFLPAHLCAIVPLNAAYTLSTKKLTYIGRILDRPWHPVVAQRFIRRPATRRVSNFAFDRRGAYPPTPQSPPPRKGPRLSPGLRAERSWQLIFAAFQFTRLLITLLSVLRPRRNPPFLPRYLDGIISRRKIVTSIKWHFRRCWINTNFLDQISANAQG